MYRVLVPVDRNRERTVHQAKYLERLADTTGEVEATVLYVGSPDEFDDPDDPEFGANAAAVGVADSLEAAGIPVQRSVALGTASKQILLTADEFDADEIVMGGRKRSGVTMVLLGSTVHDVMLSTDRAVTITGEEASLGEGTRTVLLPVDKDVDRALQQAEYLETLRNAGTDIEAAVLYVFRHQDYKGAPEHEFAEIDAAVEAADYLEEAGVSVERVAVGGEITSKIIDTAEEHDVDGIVMGGRKRSGVQKVLMGSTALDVILSAGRPVTLTG